MIYHEITQSNPFKVFLNLEELVCLSSLVNQKCNIKGYEDFEHLFDFSNFNKIKNIPEDVVECDFSDYVCVFDKDINDIEGSEFISYRRGQVGNIFRLDKFQYQNLNLILKKPNLYESKYFSSDLNYKSAIKEASLYSLSQTYLDKFEHLKRIIMNYPLFVFEPVMIKHLKEEKYKFDFDQCFYITDTESAFVEEFLKSCGLNPINFRKFLIEFNSLFVKENEKLISTVVYDSFSDIYGMPCSDLYSMLCKLKYRDNIDWKPKVLGKYMFAASENFEFKTVNKTAFFTFVQKNFNLSRIDILNLMRFKECC